MSPREFQRLFESSLADSVFAELTLHFLALPLLIRSVGCLLHSDAVFWAASIRTQPIRVDETLSKLPEEYSPHEFPLE